MLEALGLPGEAATALAMAAGLRTWAAAPRDLHVAHALALAQVGSQGVQLCLLGGACVQWHLRSI